MRMKKCAIVVTAVLPMAAVLIIPGFVTKASAEVIAGVEVGDAVSVSAEVVGINSKHRILTLLGEGGTVVDVEAGDEVRNFKQIKVGDTITARYYESVALYISMPGEEADAQEGSVVVAAAKGEKPGMFAADAIDVSATVEKIHKLTHKVTLKMADGSTMTTKVDKSMRKALEELEVGDAIHVRLTQAVAIGVE